MKEKIAYLILAHDDPVHFERLINRLNDKADFYVHIDRKTSQLEFQNKVGNLENVKFISERYPIYWAGFNMVKATTALLRGCLAEGNTYKRIILLSGSDYPLVSNPHIHDFFDSYSDTEFIRASNISDKVSQHHANHIQRYFFRDNFFVNKDINKAVYFVLEHLNVLLPLRKRSRFFSKSKNYDIFMGSQWWAITQECAEAIMGFIHDHPEIDRYFKYSFAPDEKYFHTIVYNLDYKNKTVFGEDEEFVCNEYKWPIWPNVHHLHPSLQKWYGLADYQEIMNSSQLFIRKVNTQYSKLLLDLIDSRLSGSGGLDSYAGVVNGESFKCD